MTTQPVDSSILHEVVRIIDSRGKVPEKVIVKSREYVLTYLEDHQRRMEEALHRFDRDRLNMLYGQLASKIKYQLLRRVPARAAAALGATAALKSAKKAAAKPAPAKAKPKPKAKLKPKAKPAAAKKRPAAKKPAPKRPAPRKPAPKRAAVKKPKKAKAAAKKRR